MRILGIKGDTIIEVLIAIAVLGSIITGSYAIATRSLNGVRISQERGEALKIAESQIEIIKGRIESAERFDSPIIAETIVLLPPLASARPDRWFCLGTGTPALKTFSLSSNDPARLNEYGNPECIRGRYHIAVTTDGSTEITSGGNVIGRTVQIRVGVYWEQSGGGGVEQLELNYKATI